MPRARYSAGHRRTHRAPFAAALALLLVSSGARAQQPKDDEPPVGAIPRGPGGAVLKPAQPPEAPAPAAQPTMPRPLNYADPEYPPAAKKAGIEGEVVLELDISKDGKVLRVAVKKGAGQGFDEAATEAANKLQFEPARKPDGTPFGARILYRYSFTLKAKAPPPESVAPKSVENLTGRVLASGGDAPLAGATVSALGTSPGSALATATTDEQGRFKFVDLPEGVYRVSVKAPGYDGLEVEEDIKKGVGTEVKYRLLPTGGELEVTVRGARAPREVTKRTLDRREIERIPGTNGDALRSIQSLPGVARPPAILGLLVIRGSNPQDTQTFVDGTPVPLIYHFGGLSSVVPTELLDKIDFYPGNFSTQYGRVMGGIIDVGIRSPRDKQSLYGLVQVDLIDSRLLLEGPIPFLKGWTFAAAGRRSYIDAWLGPVLEGLGAAVTTAPVYYDYQFMVETKPDPDSKFRIMFFGSDDAFEILNDQPAPGEPALSGGTIGFHTAFQRIQLLYQKDLKDGDKIRAVAAVGKDSATITFGTLYGDISLQTLTSRFEFTKKINKGLSLNTGLDVFAGLYQIEFRFPPPPRPGEPPNGPFSTRTVREVKADGEVVAPAAYLELEIAPHSRVKIVPGVRFDYATISEGIDVSPRVNARVDINQPFPRTTAKGGVGLFQQPPQFQEGEPPIGSGNLSSNRSIHYEIGMEQEFTRHLELSAVGFYKQLDNLVFASPSLSGATVVYENQGKGYVIGSELLLKYKADDRFFGWLAYTLSRSTRVDFPGGAEHLIPFDQTHILTVLGSYKLGWGWEFGARFRLVSGNLVTPNVCDASSQECDPRRTNSLYHAASGVYTPIPLSTAYTERLPMFHQLDMRLDKRWKFKRWQLSAYLDVSNVYNRANVEALAYNFNYTARTTVAGLPILPSIGMRGEF